MEPIGCPEKSVTTNQRCVTCQKSEEIVNTAAGISKPIEGWQVKVKVKVKQSHDRPGQALRVPRV